MLFEKVSDVSFLNDAKTGFNLTGFLHQMCCHLLLVVFRLWHGTISQTVYRNQLTHPKLYTHFISYLVSWPQIFCWIISRFWNGEVEQQQNAMTRSWWTHALTVFAVLQALLWLERFCTSVSSGSNASHFTVALLALVLEHSTAQKEKEEEARYPLLWLPFTVKCLCYMMRMLCHMEH